MVPSECTKPGSTLRKEACGREATSAWTSSFTLAFLSRSWLGFLPRGSKPYWAKWFWSGTSIGVTPQPLLPTDNSHINCLFFVSFPLLGPFLRFQDILKRIHLNVRKPIPYDILAMILKSHQFSVSTSVLSLIAWQQSEQINSPVQEYGHGGASGWSNLWLP